MLTQVDAIVIGSGPGGYPCGIRLGQLGVKTVVVEKGEPGGVCLNVGCIPSKALIYAAKTYEKLGHSADIGIVVSESPTVDMAKMQEWKGGVVKKLTGGVKQLLKANGAELVFGTARLAKGGSGGRHKVIVAGDNGETTYEAKNVVLATGSRPVVIPGFDTDQDKILDSTGGLALTEVPERMVVIGGGYIGLELGTVYAKLGSKVTVVEALPSLLSGMDKDGVKLVQRKLKKMGVEIMLEAKAKSWTDKGDRLVLTVAAKDGSDVAIDCDKILVAVGRRPNSENLGLEELGIKTDRGFVVADKKLRTNVPGIYAIGDLDRRHDAGAQGDQGGRGGRRDHRRPQRGDGRPDHSGGRLHRSRDRVDRHDRGRGREGRLRNQGRQVPIRRPGPRAQRQRHRRRGQGDHRRQQQRDPRRAHHRQRRLRPDQRSRPGHRDGRRRPRRQPDHPSAPDPVRGGQRSRRRRRRRGDSHRQQMTAARIVDLGVEPYRDTWKRQLALVDERKVGDGVDTIYFVEHPHVITLGRSRAAQANVLAPGEVDVVEIERGGDVTYHGPGQLVAYPILRLEEGERDLHKFLRNLEEAMIRTLAGFDIAAGRVAGATGVWVGPGQGGAFTRKIASIGIACRRWVTFHGLALNVNADLSYFTRINPCGFEASVMTSMARERGGPVDMGAVKDALGRDLAATLGRDL